MAKRDTYGDVGSCRLRNVSTTYQERYQSANGNVIIERVEHGAGRGAWRVLRRGREPYITGTKREAVTVACARARRRRR